MTAVLERTRLIVACVALASACNADPRVDPADLQLRDLLGISADAAAGWDGAQRSAARRVIEDGLRHAEGSPVVAPLGPEPAIDLRVAKALAALDDERADHDAGALGLVRVAIGGGNLRATTRSTTIQPRESPVAPVELRFAGWDADPAWARLPDRGRVVLSTIATDAGHSSGPLVVTPAARLAVIAGYLPATETDAARLVINPVLLAALEPAESGSTTAVTGDDHAGTTSPAAAPNGGTVRSPVPIVASAPGNPYSFYGSVAECAVAEQARCEACLASHSCTAITTGGDGNAECTLFDANDHRGDYLICINLALAISSVSSCTNGSAPACAQDTHAADSIKSIDNNARFLDDATCSAPLDACLADIFGAPQGPFPGPGGDAGAASTPRDPSVGCGDSDSNCDASPDCELDGPSCDSPSCDDACSDSNDGGDSGGCSGDSEDSCGSENSDCGGGDSGGDCGGGDCGGGGGDCGGGGGDCGGGDCNAGGRRVHGAGGSASLTILWAFLPVPFAARVRRRARRRRAVAEYERDHEAAS